MSGISPRIGFELPEPSDSMKFGDMVLAKNYVILDDSAGITSVTSATRPSPAFKGQTIYETDTTKYMMYDGVTWVPFIPAGSGTIRGYTVSSVNGTTFNNVEKFIPDMTMTVNVLGAGIVHGILGSFDLSANTGVLFQYTVRIRIVPGNTVALTDPIVYSYTDMSIANVNVTNGSHMGRTEMFGTPWVPAIPGPHTIGVSIQTPAAGNVVEIGGTHVGSACHRNMIVEMFL